MSRPRAEAALVSTLLAAVLVGLLALGSGALHVEPAEAADVTLPLSAVGDVTTWPGTPFRWKDVAWNLYAEAYRNTFAYDSPLVSVTFDDRHPQTLYGQLVATGLKPHFAYQMKLVGRNSKVWGAEGDDVSNERLGFAGRWWRREPSPGNTSDSEYLSKYTDPNYIFEGYLFFDFFITDEVGSAIKDFSIDSSFHVLFTTAQRTPGGNDSAPVSHTVLSDGSHPAYDGPVGPALVEIYAQWEPGRSLPGALVLPTGDYRVQLILTEESFHDSGLGGYWATAMGAEDLRFTLGAEDGSCEGQGGDADGDGVCSDSDNCPIDDNPEQEDEDIDVVGDVCDNCPGDYNPAQGDADSDGLGDACDPCATGTEIDAPRAVVREATATRNSRLRLVGELALGGVSELDPRGNGMAFTVTDSTGETVAQVVLPPGAFQNPGPGWKVNQARTKWTYRDPSGNQGGIVLARIVDRSRRSPGVVRFKIKGRAGGYGLAEGASALDVLVLLDGAPGPHCGEVSFGSALEPEPNCRTRVKAPGLICK